MKIYSKGGVLLAEVNETPYSGTFMGERFVTCTVKSPEQIQFLPDDYIDYRGERFVLDYTPTDKKIASSGSTGDAFQYELKFVSIANIELKRCLFRNTFLNDNKLHPSSPIVDVFANAQLLSNMILASLNEKYQGENQWNITVIKDVDAKQINVRDISCWDAVALFKSEFNLNYIIKGRNITVGTVGKLIDHIFKYGKGNGLTEIVRTAQSSDTLVTKLSAFGGNRNLPKDYSTYAEAPTLMLPDYKTTGKDYIISEEGVKLYGEIPTVFRDEEIYPSVYGVTADDLRAAGVQTTATGRIDEIVYVEPIQSANQASFRAWIKDIGFDINNYLTPVTALLSMRDGSLGGYEFEITKVVKDTSVEGAGYKLTLNRNQDDNFALPDDKTSIKPGDHFVLLEIYMPEVYVKTAEQRLLNRAKEYLAQNDHIKGTYSLNLDKVFMANHPSIGDTIYEGDLIRMVDEDLRLDRGIIIQNLTIKNSGPVPEYTITLSDDPVATTLGRVQEDIVDIEQNVIANKADGIKEARRRSIELQLLKSNIFDPDGEIKDTFLQTMMLQVGANSMNYQMGKTSARPRFVNMSFTNTSITLGVDDVIHFAYGAREEAASTWHIDSPLSVSGLDETKTYFVAIKASRDNLNAEWIVDENTYSVEAFSGHYIFNFGILNAVIDGQRSFSETRGNIYSYGDELAAGVISSVDNYCWFNLNTGDFQLYNKKTGQGLQFKDGVLTLGSFDPISGKFNTTIEGIIDDAKEAGTTAGSSAAQNEINNLQIGGVNLLNNSKSIFLQNSDYPGVTSRQEGKIIVTGNGHWNAYVGAPLDPSVLKTKNKEFVISVELYANMDITPTVADQWLVDNGWVVHKIIPISVKGGAWNRYSYVVKTPDSDNISSFLISFSGTDNLNLNLEYRNFMMEAGNKASATWRPSEKDNEIKRIAQGWAGGKMIYTDPTFKEGMNGIRTYNNAHSTHPNAGTTRIPKLSDSPVSDSDYNIEIKNIGLAEPGLGGFTFQAQSRINAIFVARFVAKIPEGYTVEFASNPVGFNGYTFMWITDNKGTGRWEEYIYYVQCGTYGTFGTTMFFYLKDGPYGTAANPVLWYLAYASVFDITSGESAQPVADEAKRKAEEAKVQAQAQAYLTTALNNDTTINGGLAATSLIKLGAKNSGGVWTEKSGVNGIVSSRGNNDIRFYSGGDLASAIRLVDKSSGTRATFAVTEGGKLFATDAEITGIIYATGGEFTGLIRTSLSGNRFELNPLTASFRGIDDLGIEAFKIQFSNMADLQYVEQRMKSSNNAINYELFLSPLSISLLANNVNIFLASHLAGIKMDASKGLAMLNIPKRAGSGDWGALVVERNTGQLYWQ